MNTVPHPESGEKTVVSGATKTYSQKVTGDPFPSSVSYGESSCRHLELLVVKSLQESLTRGIFGVVASFKHRRQCPAPWLNWLEARRRVAWRPKPCNTVRRGVDSASRPTRPRSRPTIYRTSSFQAPIAATPLPLLQGQEGPKP